MEDHLLIKEYVFEKRRVHSRGCLSCDDQNPIRELCKGGMKWEGRRMEGKGGREEREGGGEG